MPVNFLIERPIEKLMDNPWVGNLLAPAAPVVKKCPPRLDGRLEGGGPLQVIVRPAAEESCAAAFYDQETNILSVNILPFAPYDSYVESDEVRIDTDQHGQPVFIELSRPRDAWQIVPGLAIPRATDEGTLHLRETLRTFPSAEILTDYDRKALCIKLLARTEELVVRLADNLLAEIAEGFLVAIWLTGVQVDFAGRKQSRWRVATAARLRKKGCTWDPCTRGKLSENSTSR